MATIVGARELVLPQFEGPEQSIAKWQGIKSMMENQQLRQAQLQGLNLENQQRRQEMQDQKILQKVLADPSTDWTQPDALTATVNKAVQAGVSPQGVMKLRNSLDQGAKDYLARKKAEREDTQSKADTLYTHLSNILSAPPEQQPILYQQIRQQDIAAGLIDAAHAPEQFPGADALQIMRGSLGMSANLYKDAESRKQQEATLAETKRHNLATEGKEAKESEVEKYISNWLAERNLPNTPANWNKAHKAWTNETKTQPGVARLEVLGDVRMTGSGVYDSKLGMTVPMTINQYKRAAAAEPGRYRSPQYDTELQGGISGARAAGREFAVGTESDQLQAFRTFLRHADDLDNASNSFARSGSPWVNQPLNVLRQKAAGDPQVAAYLAKIEPVRKEYESFLLNNRALYQEDRQEAQKLLDENLNAAQVTAVVRSFAHTASARLGALNLKSQEARGKGITIDPETSRILKKFGENPAAIGGQAQGQTQQTDQGWFGNFGGVKSGR